MGYIKSTELQGINITSVSTGSNHSEISKAMEKISETNQLLAQQQMAQQKTLQVLLYHQEETSEVQEASQRIQSQALMALTEATQQRGFNPLFNKIAKYDRKDPEKCHYWLNQVWVACMESGRNFLQSLMFCAEDAVLAVLSGLNPGLMDEQVKEEIMRCFSPDPTRRQAIEKLRAMHQEPDEQMRQYIVRHEVAHLRAHRLTADEQCSTSEIIKFAINLQLFVQDKLLKKIDGNRPPRSLREAYDQALDLEHKNQITKRYEMSTQALQITECSIEGEFEGVEVMEFHPCRENIGPTSNNNNRVQKNFNQTNSGSFNRERRNDGYNQRPPFENSNRGPGRGTNRNFHSQCQEDAKPTKWDAQFQAYGIDGRVVLETLKKLTVYTILWGNGPETDYSRH